jgi:radical SAM superfamily enzyme YgiQ (UPF0313 family)
MKKISGSPMNNILKYDFLPIIVETVVTGKYRCMRGDDREYENGGKRLLPVKTARGCWLNNCRCFFVPSQFILLRYNFSYKL